MLQDGWHDTEEAAVIQKLGLKWYWKVNNTCLKSSMVQRKPLRLHHHHPHSSPTQQIDLPQRQHVSANLESQMHFGTDNGGHHDRVQQEGGGVGNDEGCEKYCESRIIN